MMDAYPISSHTKSNIKFNFDKMWENCIKKKQIPTVRDLWLQPKLDACREENKVAILLLRKPTIQMFSSLGGRFSIIVTFIKGLLLSGIVLRTLQVFYLV